MSSRSGRDMTLSLNTHTYMQREEEGGMEEEREKERERKSESVNFSSLSCLVVCCWLLEKRASCLHLWSTGITDVVYNAQLGIFGIVLDV